MNRFRRLLLAGALALGTGAMAGCASTSLVNMWSAPDFSTPMQTIFVIAVTPVEGNRRIMEDAFVTELGKHGVRATAAYTVFPAAMPDTQAVGDYVRANGLNGVLVAARLPTQERTEETPGYTTTEPRTMYSSWTGRYNTYYTQVQHEGTTEVHRIVPHLVEVWYADGKGGQLVWTAEDRNIDPSSATQVSKEMSGAIVPELAKAGIILAKR
jgi:hypothetical protein